MNRLQEYDRLIIERERARIVKLIQDQMLAWGHHGAPGCVCCITARGLIEAIEKDATASLTSSRVRAPEPCDDGVVVTVHEGGEK